MISYISLISGMLMLPVLYSLLFLWYRREFKKEENQEGEAVCTEGRTGGPVHRRTCPGQILVSSGKVRLRRSAVRTGISDACRDAVLLYLRSAERVVPNKLLLGFFFLFPAAAGLYGLTGRETMGELLPSAVSGMVFSALCFGAGYLLGRGRMGAGDVKLSLVMGLYLTAEYVTGAILYGCIAGAAYSAFRLIRTRGTEKAGMPLVPFLYIGMIVRLFMG